MGKNVLPAAERSDLPTALVTLSVRWGPTA